MEIIRKFEHKTHGPIGQVALVVPDTGWTMDGAELPEASIRHLATFALQTLQDAYANSADRAEAVGAWTKKLDKIMSGEMGTRETGPRNPVLKRALEIAAKHCKRAGNVFTLGKHTIDAGSKEGWADAEKKIIARAVETNPAYMSLAQKAIDEENAIDASADLGE